MKSKFQKLPINKTYDGRERLVGFEFEIAGIELQTAVKVITDLFGGNSVIKNSLQAEVQDTKLGIFKVELDSLAIKEMAASLENNSESNTAKTNTSKIIGSIAAQFVPLEIITSPLHFEQFESLEMLREELYKKKAEGTRSSIVNAFGLHINPEVPSFEVEDLLNYLRAFLVLFPWLKEAMNVDIKRRILNYIDPFPDPYVKLVLNKNYNPDLDEFIDDYLNYNPTRNRALDFLPLFAHINPEKLKVLKPESIELVKARPTLHYRLPNCEVDDLHWTIARDWNYWVEVERLAGDKTKLLKMAKAYLVFFNNPIYNFQSKWIKYTSRQLNYEHKEPNIGVINAEYNKGVVFWWCIKLGIWMAGGKAHHVTSARPGKLEHFHAFILAGGEDINPDLYGERSTISKNKYNINRDGLEQKVIAYALENKRPVLGICRGMQMLNITAGGSLHQEIKNIFEDFLSPESLLGKILIRKNIQINEDSQLFKIIRNTNYKVNSLHHQAINKVGAGLRVVAKEKDILIQAIEKDKTSDHPFIVGVQWHPELMLHTRSARNLFKALVNAAKEVDIRESET